MSQTLKATKLSRLPLMTLSLVLPLEGGHDFDVVEVNGAVDAGDNFELRANGDKPTLKGTPSDNGIASQRAEFERLNLGNFILDVDDVEQFEINGLGGDDTLTVQDLTG